MDLKWEIIYDICMIVIFYLCQNMIIITYVLSFVLLHRNGSGGNLKSKMYAHIYMYKFHPYDSTSDKYKTFCSCILSTIKGDNLCQIKR